MQVWGYFGTQGLINATQYFSIPLQAYEFVKITNNYKKQTKYFITGFAHI